MENDNKIKLEVLLKPNEFFHRLIQDSIALNKVYLSEELQVYVVDVLSRFIHSDHLYSINSDGSYKEQPLAFMMKEAEDELALDVKKLMFRKIGDIALFTIGVFPAKNVSTEYYGFMGKIAYSQAAALYSKSNRAVYLELSTNFERIAYILQKIPSLKIKVV